MAEMFYDVLRKVTPAVKGGKNLFDPDAPTGERIAGGAEAAGSTLELAGTALGGTALGTGLSAAGGLGTAFSVGYGLGTWLDGAVETLTGTSASDRVSDAMTPSMDELAEEQGMVRVKRRGVAGIDDGNRLAQRRAIATMQAAAAHQQEIGRDIQLSRSPGVDGAVARARLHMALGHYED
jgi:hypothetical protein